MEQQLRRTPSPQCLKTTLKDSTEEASRAIFCCVLNPIGAQQATSAVSAQYFADAAAPNVRAPLQLLSVPRIPATADAVARHLLMQPTHHL
jgi:hypothetical protein